MGILGGIEVEAMRSIVGCIQLTYNPRELTELLVYVLLTIYETLQRTSTSCTGAKGLAINNCVLATAPWSYVNCPCVFDSSDIV